MSSWTVNACTKYNVTCKYWGQMYLITQMLHRLYAQTFQIKYLVLYFKEHIDE